MELTDLERFGFNLSEAMELCVDDEEILREVLETALEEGREKIPFLNELMKTKDYDRYVVEVHGLKNAAKQIGADELSEEAKLSEFAGKEGRIDDMRARHDHLIELYKNIVDALEKFFA